MKLAELLFEDPIDTKDAEDLWAEHEADSASYITSVVYDVKPSAAKSGFFEVTFNKQGRRATYAILSKTDLSASFTPLRSNQAADAEGYVKYRSSDIYDAFKYNGDPVRVNLGAARPTLLNSGDYLLRQVDGENFTYTIEKASYFDNGYVKKV